MLLSTAVLLWLLATAIEGSPLFYWGARAPVIAVEPREPATVEAAVTQVQAAAQADELFLRFTFDRPVSEAIRLPDGAPVSGRLRVLLYVDADDDARTGWDLGAWDQRTGSERKLEVGVIALGADPEEQREASAIVIATAYELTADGRQQNLWQTDDAAQPATLSLHGQWLELRVPIAVLGLGPRASRLVLVQSDQAFAGRLTR
jgi:hypothetical protein